MILFACAIWFTGLYYFGFKYSIIKDGFGPVKLLTTKMIIMNIPFLYFIAFYPEKFDLDILRVINLDLPDAVFNYTIIQTVSYVFLLLGIRFGKRITLIKKIKLIKIFKSNRIYNFFSFLFFLIGLNYYYTFLKSAGGLFYVVSNLSQRTELLNTGDGIGYTIFFLTLSIILLMFSYAKQKSKFKFSILIIYFILITFIFSTTGGRKNTLYLIIFLLGAINYYLVKINIKNINKLYLVVGIAILSFYILIVPVFRQKDGLEKIINNEIQIVDVIELQGLVNSISYTYIDIFAANYFNSQNFWYFSGFNDLLLNFSSLEKDLRPPIDDGMYFRTIVVTKSNFKPSTPRGSMIASSWPIEHFGFSFANIGIMGIIIFSFILGVIYFKFYKLMVINNFEPIFLYLYIFVVFNFNFSNLRLVQFFTFIPLVIIYVLVMKILQKK